MADIKITTVDTDYIEIEFRDQEKRHEKRRRRRSEMSVDKNRSGAGGIELTCGHQPVILLQFSVVDDVNGTTPTSDEHLYTLLTALMTP